MVAKRLDILAKILADELTFDFDEQGQVTGAHELPKKKKGSYRIASAADPDATYRVHGERIDFGFNISVAATDTFIRESQADTGSQPDAVAIPTCSPPSRNITTWPLPSSSTTRLPAPARVTPMSTRPPTVRPVGGAAGQPPAGG